MGDNRRETRWDGGRERGRQGQLVRRKTKRDRDEDGDRRKERQRSLERLKQRGRNRDAYGDWNGVDQIQGRIQKVRDIQKTSPGGSGRVGVQGQAGEGAR